MRTLYIRKEACDLVLEQLLVISGSFALEEIVLAPFMVLKNGGPLGLSGSKIPLTDEKTEVQGRYCPLNSGNI